MDVTARAAALTAALDSGAPWLDPDVVDEARASINHVLTRMSFGADHTVVALVGATGSGKSSLFNALARMEIAPVGPRRPLTSMPMACVWGQTGSQQLLDWLNVPESRRILRESVLDADVQAPLNGLVLLDLPDHDSTEVAHRVEVDRLVRKVDLLIWVVDPQKYADDALHSGYLQRMTGHDGVMLVVLNQIDRLGPDEADTCVQDLRRLLDGDGLSRVGMLAISATRGDGVDALRALLAGVARDRFAIAERIGADLQIAVTAVRAGLAGQEPGDGEPVGVQRLTEELAAAAGVPGVLDVLAGEYRRRGWESVDWPLLRWGRQVLPKGMVHPVGSVFEHELRLFSGSLLSVSTPAQRPAVEAAVQATIAANTEPLPQRWADEVRTAVSRSEQELAEALDQDLAAVDLTLVPPPWWRAAVIGQYVLSIAALLGAAWLFLLGVSHLAGAGLNSPGVLGISLPLLLLILGLLGPVLLIALAAWWIVVGTRRRRLEVQERLHEAVEAVAQQRVITPIRLVLARHRVTRLALDGQPPVAGPAGIEIVEPVRRAVAGTSDPGIDLTRAQAPSTPGPVVVAIDDAVGAAPGQGPRSF
jgi:GTP-binding protein EngB required for normal cell division